MRDALIFAGLTIGAVATVFGGGEANLVAPPATQPTAATVVTEPGQAEEPAWGGTTELQRAGDGHFYAGVGLGGRSLTMLVDTGATVIAPMDELAQAVKSRYDGILDRVGYYFPFAPEDKSKAPLWRSAADLFAT